MPNNKVEDIMCFSVYVILFPAPLTKKKKKKALTKIIQPFDNGTSAAFILASKVFFWIKKKIQMKQLKGEKHRSLTSSQCLQVKLGKLIIVDYLTIMIIVVKF
uniref:Uncharacterized protein n=1 Tax=Micrurus lemniscatus lemniscatus TaxID=129467 RepID=A0A2D4J8N1_MICLE